MDTASRIRLQFLPQRSERLRPISRPTTGTRIFFGWTFTAERHDWRVLFIYSLSVARLCLRVNRVFPIKIVLTVYPPHGSNHRAHSLMSKYHHLHTSPPPYLQPTTRARSWLVPFSHLTRRVARPLYRYCWKRIQLASHPWYCLCPWRNSVYTTHDLTFVQSLILGPSIHHTPVIFTIALGYCHPYSWGSVSIEGQRHEPRSLWDTVCSNGDTTPEQHLTNAPWSLPSTLGEFSTSLRCPSLTASIPPRSLSLRSERDKECGNRKGKVVDLIWRRQSTIWRSCQLHLSQFVN